MPNRVAANKAAKGTNNCTNNQKETSKKLRKRTFRIPLFPGHKEIETLLQVEVTPIPTPKEGAVGAEHAAAVGDTQFESEDGRRRYIDGAVLSDEQMRNG